MCALLAAAIAVGCTGVPLDVHPVSEPPRPPTLLPARAQEEKLLIVATSDVGVVHGPGLDDRSLPDVAEISVGADGKDTRWRVYMMFDHTAIPTRADLHSATLVLSAGDLSGGSDQQATLLVRALTEPWPDGGVTWNTQPTAAKEPTAQLPLLQADREIRVDLTPLVVAWQLGRQRNYGVRLEIGDESASFWKGIRTVEFPGPIAGPRLELRYHVNPARAGGGSSSP